MSPTKVSGMLDTLSNRLQNVKLRIKRPGTCLRISGLYRKQISTTTLDSSDTIIIPKTNTEATMSAASMVLPFKYPHFCWVHPQSWCELSSWVSSTLSFFRSPSTKCLQWTERSLQQRPRRRIHTAHLITMRRSHTPCHGNGVTAGGLCWWGAAVVFKHPCHATGLTAEGFLAAQLRIDMMAARENDTEVRGAVVASSFLYCLPCNRECKSTSVRPLLKNSFLV